MDAGADNNGLMLNFGTPKPAKIKSATSKDKKQGQVISSLFSFNPDTRVSSNITLTPKADYAPSNGVTDDKSSGFAGLDLDDRIIQHLSGKMNVSVPTEIQKRAIPAIANEQKRDVIIQAQTGSGKTLAYLLPILNQLVRGGTRGADRSSGTMGLILCPTRELANQVSDVLQSLLALSYSPRWIVNGTLTGGEKKKSEKARLRKGVTLLVTTPGRLLDHLKHTQSFCIDFMKWCILDEADRFIELGFQNTLKEVFDLIKQKSRGAPYRTILCSATVSDAVKEIGGIQLQNPVFISSSSKSNVSMTSMPNQLHQQYLVAPPKLRLVTLTAEITNIYASHGRTPMPSARKTIVFFSNCDSVDFFYRLFSETLDEDADDAERAALDKPVRTLGSIFGIKANRVQLFKLHGNIAHAERMKTYRAFSKSNQHCILVCTDVAARGLDMPDVTHILQVDPPSDTNDYVHRMGRTARLGRSGYGLVWLLPSEIGYLERLKEFDVTGFEERKMESCLKALARKGETWEDGATRIQLAFEQAVLKADELKNMAKKAFMSSVRAYSTHCVEEKKIFHVRKLHLGHLAKAFGLRDPPSQMKAKEKKVEKRAQSYTKLKLDESNEFSSAAPLSKKRKMQ